jgi:hypothetical protein
METIYYYVDEVLALTRRGSFMTFISILAIQSFAQCQTSLLGWTRALFAIIRDVTPVQDNAL